MRRWYNNNNLGYLIMGMYDNISCEHSLLKGLSPEVDAWLDQQTELMFQTKCFDNTMDHYVIHDKQLFKKTCKYKQLPPSEINGFSFPSWEKIENSEAEERLDHTTTIRMYEYVDGEPFDTWIEFKIIFIDGIVYKVNLVEFKQEPSFERIKRNKEFEEEFKKQIEFKIIFIDGIVYKVNLVEFKQEPSFERIKRNKEFEEEFKKQIEFNRTIKGKINFWARRLINSVLWRGSNFFKRIANLIDKLRFRL